MRDINHTENSCQARRNEIIYTIALEAERRPLLDSGLWFHDDVRNNFYYASYLFAAAADESLTLPFSRDDARRKAEAVLLETVLLQNRQPGTKLYGHWPLGLGQAPREALPHELPVEIMGSLMAWFCKHYSSLFSAGLRIAFHTALGHLYRSGFFRKPVVTYGHHEAKYTAAKLILGTLFEDEELREDGRVSLENTLAYIKENGMPEYGSLPWFWHWVQAFTCAWELEQDGGVKALLAEMLDHLWSIRAAFYFRGAWVGAHSRGWPHDVPGDGNVLNDYVQFGDFELPGEMPRTEYAGFLFYEAPEHARATALDRTEPAEVKRLTQKVVPEKPNPQPRLHSYGYITGEFAAGGLWERVEEFDNEQLRWAYSLPVRAEGGANQLYFFHPGQGYHEGDPRHQSPYMEVLYHKSTIISLYPVPEEEEELLIGVLPKGEWREESRALFGHADQVYFAVYLPHDYELRERADYLEVTVKGMPGGVVVEAVGSKLAAENGMGDLKEFAAAMASKAPVFILGNVLEAQYTTIKEEQLRLTVSSTGKAVATLGGERISLKDYIV